MPSVVIHGSCPLMCYGLLLIRQAFHEHCQKIQHSGEDQHLDKYQLHISTLPMNTPNSMSLRFQIWIIPGYWIAMTQSDICNSWLQEGPCLDNDLTMWHIFLLIICVRHPRHTEDGTSIGRGKPEPSADWWKNPTKVLEFPNPYGLHFIEGMLLEYYWDLLGFFTFKLTFLNIWKHRETFQSLDWGPWDGKQEHEMPQSL